VAAFNLLEAVIACGTRGPLRHDGQPSVQGGDHEAAYLLGSIFPFVLGGVFVAWVVWHFWIRGLLEKKIELPPEDDGAARPKSREEPPRA
jgi:hypothetical protein